MIPLPFESVEVWRQRLLADNEAAIGLYRKFGFQDEGLFRDYAVRDRQSVDTLSMARLRKA